MGPPHRPARAPLPPRRHVVRRPTTPSAIALSRTTSSRNPKVEGIIEDSHRRLLEAEKHQREKSSPAGRNLPGKFPSGGGKSSPSSPSSSWTSLGSSSSSSPPPTPSSPPLHLVSAVTSRAGSCVFHRGNFPGVDYSLLLMLLSETVESRFMFRLLSIIISPLIMFHMMSCE